MLNIIVEIGSIVVSVETDSAYPDIADDLTNRAKTLINEAVEQCALSGWNPIISAEPTEEIIGD